MNFNNILAFPIKQYAIYLIMYSICYLLYYIGGIFAWIFELGYGFDFFYTPYSWCMRHSLYISDKYKLGIWVDVTDE